MRLKQTLVILLTSLIFSTLGRSHANSNVSSVSDVLMQKDSAVLEGVIIDFTTFLPIQGAEILLGNHDPIFSNNDGFFTMAVELGTYQFIVSKAGYYSFIIDDLEIIGFKHLDITLFQDAFSMDPTGVSVNYHNSPISRTVTLYNNANIPIPWTSEIVFYDERDKTTKNSITENRDLWDVLFVYDFTAASGGIQNQAGIESDGDYIYSSVFNDNKIIKYEMDGSYIETYVISGVFVGLKDLACDGEYLYGGTAGPTIYQIDLNDFNVINQISSPISVVGIAYDEGYDAFWVCGSASDFWLVGRDGNVIEVADNPGLEDNYGLACNRLVGSGHSLFVFTQSMGGADLVELDFTTGELTGVSRNVLADIPVSGDAFAKGAFIGVDEGCYLGGLIQSDNNLAFGYELGDPNWLVCSPVSGVIEPYGSTELTLVFNLFDKYYPPWELLYSDINISIEEPVLDTHILPIELQIVPVGLDEDHDIVPTIKVFPNPALHRLNLESKKEISRIRIFDHSGKLLESYYLPNLKRHSLNLNSLILGIYIIEVAIENDIVISKKVLVMN